MLCVYANVNNHNNELTSNNKTEITSSRKNKHKLCCVL